MSLNDVSPKQWIPLEHHKIGVKFLLEHAAAGLFLPPGMGKTAISLAGFKILKQQRIARKMLVVAPRRVARSVWPRQVAQWQDFSGFDIEVLRGSNREDAIKRKADIYVTTYEGLRWLAVRGRYRLIDADTLVMDELSKLKHTRTARFKTLEPMLPSFKRRWGLTGSPASQSLLNLFGECYALDLGKALGCYITHFRQEYFEPSGYGGYGWRPKPTAKERIYKKLRHLALHLDEKDFLKLPQFEPNIIEVELPDEARRVYDELEDDLFTVLPNKAQVLVPNAGAALNKCQQVAGGALYHTDEKGKREWSEIHDVKIEALQDLVDELQGDPLMIAYNYQHELERIQDALGIDYHMGGGVSDKKAAELEDAWNNGDLEVLPVQPQSVAHGLNLQEGPGHQICWFSDTWNYEEWDQLVRRLRRPGQKAAKVICHHIVAKDTVDEAMVASRARKARTQNHLLAALKSYRLRRERQAA